MIELSPALEHYLKEVHRLQRRDRYARVRDLAEGLGVAKPAVTAALRTLSQKGMIDYRPYEPVTLTDAGNEQVREILLRYRVLVKFLTEVLDLDPDRADATACAMEHAIDEVSLERIICFLAFVGKSRKRQDGWLRRFRRFMCDDEKRNCQQFIDEYLDDAASGGEDATRIP